MNLFSERDIRQRGLVPPNQLAQVHAVVIGVGAIGRQVALQLASLGVQRMTLFDHDHVAVENLAVQGYWPEDLGQAKVDATARLCRQILPELVLTAAAERFRRYPGWYPDQERIPIVCACVDSIATRRILWETFQGRVALFLDGRLQAEVIRVFAQDARSDPVHYASSLFQEQEGEVGPCTARTTLYSASLAASLMVAQLARWLRGLPVVPDQLLNLLSSELIVQGDR